MDFAQLLFGGIANGCVYGLVALGFVLIYKATESVNFAQGDLMMLGAFVTLQFVNGDRWGLNFALGVVLAIAIMGVIGYLIESVVIHRLFGQPQFAVVIMTIALGFVIRFVAGLIWGHEPQSLVTPWAGGWMDLGFGRVGTDDVMVIVTTAVLTSALWIFFARTKLGVAMQASSQNQLAAYYMGIPVKKVAALIWAIAGMLATVAGILFASKGAIDPAVGLLGIKAFAAAVIGGFGSLPGALLGGLLIGVVEIFAARYGVTGLSQMSPYVLMLVVLVLRPNGLFAQIAQKKV